MNSVAQDDLDFCWDEVLKADAWFRLHFTFAPKPVAERILALHALFAMLERPAAMSEESLALAQLAWWQAELSPEGAAASAHPVVRALRESRALENLPVSTRQALVVQALEVSRRSRPGSRGDLKTLCSGVGGARIVSELTVASPGHGLEEAEGHFAGTGLSRILALSVKSGAGLWFVPLELHARFQGGAHSIERATPEGRALMDALGDLGEEWFDEQLTALQRLIPANRLSSEQIQHLLATMASERLHLKRTIESLMEGGGSAPGSWGFMDLVKVWRDCRRHSKQTRRGVND